MNGFLGTRGSLMLDIVFLAMLAVIPLMLYSRYLVRAPRSYSWHKRIQLTLAIVLLLAVCLFELEMRIMGWSHRAEASPYWIAGKWNDWVDYSLLLHLCFAIPTPFVWGGLIWAALRKFPNPPQPSSHSRRHRLWGSIAMFMMAMTAITGWCFYWLAFAA